ncbi:MAG: hypothetical protein KI793_14180 [Rivularia sp. (in: Bacteria)]|nr:hypothetical protein [Rivularia sp. MS3]
MHQLTEVNKCVLLAITSGALGGLLQGIIQDIISQRKNVLNRNLTQRIKLYVFSCLVGSIIMGLFTFFGAMFDTSASIQNSGKFIIIYGIFGWYLTTLSTKLFDTFVFKRQEN